MNKTRQSKKLVEIQMEIDEENNQIEEGKLTNIRETFSLLNKIIISEKLNQVEDAKI